MNLREAVITAVDRLRTVKDFPSSVASFYSRIEPELRPTMLGREISASASKSSKRYIRMLVNSSNVVSNIGGKLRPTVSLNELKSAFHEIPSVWQLRKDSSLRSQVSNPSRYGDDATLKIASSIVRRQESVNRPDAKKDKSTENYAMALLKENSQLRSKLQTLGESRGNVEVFLQRVIESIKDNDQLSFTAKPWKTDANFKTKKPVSAVLHVSDWHIGSKEDVTGFNSYNYDTACARIEKLVEKFNAWIDMHRTAYNVNELVVIDTGDSISGDIHDELIRTNEFSCPEQCVKASILKAKMITELAKRFSSVRVEFVVPDNHSRTTDKIEFGDGKNSYNYIVGYLTKTLLAGIKHVKFNIYAQIQQVIQVQDARYLIMHGNSVRGGFAGIPFYSMQRKVGAESAIRMNMNGETHFDKIVMGHYHVPLCSTQYAMTGSLSGTTAFDIAAGRHCRACQSGWFVSGRDDFDRTDFWLS
jgi:hypothetical protein